MSVILLHLWVQLDHGIDTHDGNAGLNSTLELLNLAHTGLQYTSLEGIMHTALR